MADSGSKVKKTPFVSAAIEKLRGVGMRITSPRIAILETLDQSDLPLNAYALQEAVTLTGKKVDVVSVYRTLKVLRELDLVHYVQSSDGYLACRLEGEHGSASEMIVCDTCGNVMELDIDPCAMTDLSEQLSSLGFKASRITIEVEGVCKSCDGQ
ncbi:MAG: transcriptional repressor [Armatimonadetes bacterium]|nr:transcriptional repressor [Armatimonadota bacterium]